MADTWSQLEPWMVGSQQAQNTCGRLCPADGRRPEVGVGGWGTPEVRSPRGPVDGVDPVEMK